MPTPAATLTFTPYRHGAPLSLRTIALIVAVHAGLFAALVSGDVVPLRSVSTALTVDLIPAAASAATPATAAAPVEPRPAPRRPAMPQPAPVLATAAEAAATTNEAAPPRDTAPATPAAGVVTQPRFDADYLSNPAPAYPSLSRRLGEEGRVVLRVFVAAGGHPTQIEIRQGSGSPRLDDAALEAVRRWQFVPARRGDEAIAAWVLVPIVFNLKH